MRGWLKGKIIIIIFERLAKGEDIIFRFFVLFKKIRIIICEGLLEAGKQDISF